MKKCALKFVSAIGVIFVMCIVLVVGQAQASLMGPYDGAYEDPWDLKLEFDDGILSGQEGSSEDFDVTVINEDKFFVSWDFRYLGDGTHLDGITLKAGRDVFHYIVAEDQLISGFGYVESRNGKAISNISASIPDASVIMLLGSSLIFLGLIGRRKSKK